MTDWTFDRPSEPGLYLFHGHPDAEVHGIRGPAVTEVVTVTESHGLKMIDGPGMFASRAAIGMWRSLGDIPLPERTWPWENLEVVHLNKGDPATVQKPEGEPWHVIGEAGENILAIRVPGRLVVPLWEKGKTTLSELIDVLVRSYVEEQGRPPGRIVLFVCPVDGTMGLAAGGAARETS